MPVTQTIRLEKLEQEFRSKLNSVLWIELNDNTVTYKLMVRRVPARTLTFPTVDDAISFFEDKIKDYPNINGWAFVSDVTQIGSGEPYIEGRVTKEQVKHTGVHISYVGWDRKDLAETLLLAYLHRKGVPDEILAEILRQDGLQGAEIS